MAQVSITSLRKEIGSLIGPIWWSRATTKTYLKKAIDAQNTSEAITNIEKLVYMYVSNSGSDRINFALDNIEQNINDLKSKNVMDSIDMLTGISLLETGKKIKSQLKVFPTAKHPNVTIHHDIKVLFGKESINCDDVRTYLKEISKYTEVDDGLMNAIMTMKYPNLMYPQLPFIASSRSASSQSFYSPLKVGNEKETRTPQPFNGYNIPTVHPQYNDNLLQYPPPQVQQKTQQQPQQYSATPLYSPIQNTTNPQESTLPQQNVPSPVKPSNEPYPTRPTSSPSPQRFYTNYSNNYSNNPPFMPPNISPMPQVTLDKNPYVPPTYTPQTPVYPQQTPVYMPAYPPTTAPQQCNMQASPTTNYTVYG
ncbi:hypothetical protein TRFO_32730 [Tritrichomonas foetus]|uniref:Uncharacterized protein n=1 Tax=Tritrichomonas foetus TaxID=1144522 RepID=A0A1J4JPD9_9EUKA|nr:hypothetical protein TRFO_32730 [Tritrichomonas foetus]|eukprot:OHT00610.1 hypothetical protein TRFO_32730 [Tritrichomonas foetus]